MGGKEDYDNNELIEMVEFGKWEGGRVREKLLFFQGVFCEPKADRTPWIGGQLTGQNMVLEELSTCRTRNASSLSCYRMVYLGTLNSNAWGFGKGIKFIFRVCLGY